MTPDRPVLRYHGGKWRDAEWVVANMPPHQVYVELFGGGASVLLQKPRSKSEVYNDLDGEVVNLFRVLRDRPDELTRAVWATPFARAEFEEAYLQSDDPVERARRTLVRCHMGHSGVGVFGTSTGFRANDNSAGTPASLQWRNLPPSLAAAAERLRGVVVERRDALEVVAQQDGPDTLFYADPPYLPETRDAGEDYNHEMDERGHILLAEALRSAKGSALVSGYSSALYDRLYSGWRRVEKKSRAGNNSPRTEVLWCSREPEAARQPGLPLESRL